MDTFKFIDVDSGELYNYIPEGVSFRILCSSDGSRHDSDYLRFDSIDKVFRYRNDAVFLDYLNIWTSQNNTSWSDVNDQYILNRDCRYDEEVDDSVFIGEYENLNSVERIEERKKQLSKRKSGRSISSYFDSMLGDINLQSPHIQEIIRNLSERQQDWSQSIDIETEV
jgi:hypothetical protein